MHTTRSCKHSHFVTIRLEESEHFNVPAGYSSGKDVVVVSLNASTDETWTGAVVAPEFISWSVSGYYAKKDGTASTQRVRFAPKVAWMGLPTPVRQAILHALKDQRHG